MLVRSLAGLLSAMAFLHLPAVAATTYTVTLVTPTAPNTWINLLKINSLKHYVAIAGDDFGSTSFYLQEGSGGQAAITPPNGITISEIDGLNDADQVVGQSSGGGFIWTASGGWNYISPAQGYSSAFPEAINNKGEVVGFLERNAEPSSRIAFTWTATGGMKIPRPQLSVAPAGINSSGDIAATEFYIDKGAAANDVLSIEGRSIKRIGDLRPGPLPSNSVAVAINRSGHIVLNALTNSIQGYIAPAFWSKGAGLVDMGAVEGVTYGLSDNDTAIGNTLISPAYAFVWDPTSGLNNIANLLAPRSPNLQSIGLAGISSNGYIGGYYIDGPTGEYYGVIFTPTN